jgi:uncharacterized protein YegL
MKNYTDITMILDKSASMSHLTTDTIGGFNKFLEDQKKDKEKAIFSLFQFETNLHEICMAKKIQDVELLNNETYIADGPSTSLRDAIGQVVNKVGKRLKNLNEANRPDKVLIVIQTDGQENSSKEFTQKQIEEMVKHQEEKYQWKFIFLGAGLDVAAQAQNFNFALNNTLAYGNNSEGFEVMYTNLSRSVSNLKSMDSVAYSQTDAFTEEVKKEVERTID